MDIRARIIIAAQKISKNSLYNKKIAISKNIFRREIDKISYN